MTNKEPIIINGKTIECPCYIDRPLHRYDKGCLIQSQVFKEQQTEEKPILRCDEIKNCPMKESYKQLQRKIEGYNQMKEALGLLNGELVVKTTECSKYEQALDEIENYICRYEMLGKVNIKYVLYIISKVKDGNE